METNKGLGGSLWLGYLESEAMGVCILSLRYMGFVAHD